MRAVQRLPAAAAFASLGCSLGHLGDFDVPKCDDDAKCAPLNEYHGLSPQTDCLTYHCRSDADGCELRMTDFDGDGFVGASCARRIADSASVDCQDDDPDVYPGNEELCDGKDNDCDRVIDEGTAPERDQVVLTLAAADPDDVATSVCFGSPKAAPVTSADRDPAPVFACSAEEHAVAAQLLIPDGDPPRADPLVFAYQRTQDTVGFEKAESADQNCPTQASFLKCTFDDTVAARIDGAWIVSAISRAGCSAGQLRVGYREGDGSPEVGLRGPDQHSNLYLGVDVGDGACTGASRDSGIEGVTRLSLAGQNGDTRQALLAVIADRFDRPICGGSSRDVEVLGVWLEQLGQDLMWTNGANDGIPQVLGQSSGGGRPVVQAIKSEGVPLGYVVAYGASEGGLALHRLPLFDDPPAYERGQAQSRSTVPIELGTKTLLFSDHLVDHVALTQVGVEGDHLELGLAWVEGCGRSDAQILFARARYFWDSHTFVGDKPLKVASAKRLHEPPSLLHVDSGFVAPGFQRGGSTAASDRGGGFFVAWRDAAAGNELGAARVLELDSKLLDVTTLKEASDAVGLHLFYAGDSATFAFYEPASGKVRAGPLQCGRSAAVGDEHPGAAD
ncbi:MAG: putative metal-binding motif-containing protein [Polyangiaceae bacterium]|nr:putative metal-binding motif-containing protein [Polyangiaceae bacterium]